MPGRGRGGGGEEGGLSFFCDQRDTFKADNWSLQDEFCGEILYRYFFGNLIKLHFFFSVCIISSVSSNLCSTQMFFTWL